MSDATVTWLRITSSRILNDAGMILLSFADTHASHEDVVEPETYWKNVLMSREFGYNGN